MKATTFIIDRRITQLETLADKWGKMLVALCDDGTMWKLDVDSRKSNWVELPKIPPRDPPSPELPVNK